MWGFRRGFNLLVVLCCSFQSPAQHLEYGRELVDKLASPQFHGRGYVKKGHKKAATFIAREFRQIGLKTLGQSIFQEFPLKVNTFPGSMLLELDGKLLRPGFDYLVSPDCPPIIGEFELVRLNSLVQVPFVDDKVIVYDDEVISTKEIRNLLRTKLIRPKAIMRLTNQKLIWGLSQVVSEIPELEVKKSVFGFDASSVKLIIQSKLQSIQSRNVIGFLKGENNDSAIYVTAHYDHLGRMGKKTFFPGANDNASGVAMMLSLARHFSLTKPKFDLIFIAFGAEEVGLIGSKYYVENPYAPLDKVKFVINLDILGTGDDGIQIVNSTVFNKEFNSLKRINDNRALLPNIKTRGEACNSDHCMFHAKGIPSFFIYTLGGIQAYHDPLDRRETLPLTEFEDLHRLLTEFIAAL